MKLKYDYETPDIMSDTDGKKKKKKNKNHHGGKNSKRVVTLWTLFYTAASYAKYTDETTKFNLYKSHKMSYNILEKYGVAHIDDVKSMKLMVPTEVANKFMNAYRGWYNLKAGKSKKISGGDYKVISFSFKTFMKMIASDGKNSPIDAFDYAHPVYGIEIFNADKEHIAYVIRD